MLRMACWDEKLVLLIGLTSMEMDDYEFSWICTMISMLGPAKSRDQE
jgi:hypothetical protein